MNNRDLSWTKPAPALPDDGGSTSLVKVLRKTAEMIDGLEVTSRKPVHTPRGASNLLVVRDMYKQLCTVLHEAKMLEKTSILEASSEKTRQEGPSPGTTTREHSRSVRDVGTRQQNRIRANRPHQVDTMPHPQGSSPGTHRSATHRKALPNLYSARVGQSSAQHIANYSSNVLETAASYSNPTKQTAQSAAGESSVLPQNRQQKTENSLQVKDQVLGHFSSPGIKRTASRELKENFDFQRSRMGHNIPKSVELALWYILLKNPALSFTDLNAQWLGGLVSANLVCVDGATLVAKYGSTLPAWSTESICGHILSFKPEESGVSELFRQWDAKFKGPRTAATDEQKKQYSGWIRGRAEASRWLASQSESQGVGSIARHQAEKRAREGAQQPFLLVAQGNKKLRQEVDGKGNTRQETRKAINREAAQTMMAHHVPESSARVLQARDAYQEADLLRSEENERRIQATKLKIKGLEERAAGRAHKKRESAQRSLEAPAALEASDVMNRRAAPMAVLKETHKTLKRASEASRADDLEKGARQEVSASPGRRTAFHHSIQSAQHASWPQECASSPGPQVSVGFAPQPIPGRPKEPSVIGARKLELLRAKIQRGIFERKEAENNAAEARCQAQIVNEESKAKQAASGGDLLDSTARARTLISQGKEPSRKAQKERDAEFKAKKECEAHLRARQLVAELTTPRETDTGIKFQEKSELAKKFLQENMQSPATVEADSQARAVKLGVNRTETAAIVRQSTSEVYPPFRRAQKHSRPSLGDDEDKLEAQAHRRGRRTQHQRATSTQAYQELSSPSQKLQLAKGHVGALPNPMSDTEDPSTMSCRRMRPRDTPLQKSYEARGTTMEGDDHTPSHATPPPTAAHEQGRRFCQSVMNVVSNGDKVRDESPVNTQAETKGFLDGRGKDGAEAMRQNKIKAEVQHKKAAPTPPPPRRGGIAAQIGKASPKLQDTSPKQSRPEAQFYRGDASPPMSTDNDLKEPNLQRRNRSESKGMIDARKAEVTPNEKGAPAFEKKTNKEAESKQEGLRAQRSACTTFDKSLKPEARISMKPKQPSGRTEAQEAETLQGNPPFLDAAVRERVSLRTSRKLRRAREIEPQAYPQEHQMLSPYSVNQWVDDQQMRLENEEKGESHGSQPRLFAAQPCPPMPTWVVQASRADAMREQSRLIEARRDEARTKKAGQLMFEHPKVESPNTELSDQRELEVKPRLKEEKEKTSKRGQLHEEESKKGPEEALRKNKASNMQSEPGTLQELYLSASAEDTDSAGEWEMLEKPGEAPGAAKTSSHTPDEGRQEKKGNHLFRFGYRK